MHIQLLQAHIANGLIKKIVHRVGTEWVHVQARADSPKIEAAIKSLPGIVHTRRRYARDSATVSAEFGAVVNQEDLSHVLEVMTPFITTEELPQAQAALRI